MVSAHTPKCHRKYINTHSLSLTHTTLFPEGTAECNNESCELIFHNATVHTHTHTHTQKQKQTQNTHTHTHTLTQTHTRAHTHVLFFIGTATPLKATMNGVSSHSTMPSIFRSSSLHYIQETLRPLQVWRDSPTSATWLIHTCDITQDDAMSVTWLIYVRDMTRSNESCHAQVSRSLDYMSLERESRLYIQQSLRPLQVWRPHTLMCATWLTTTSEIRPSTISV